MLRVHCVHHAAFEGATTLDAWAQVKGFPVTHTHVYRGESFPKTSDFDFLVVFGGPMSAFHERQHPWLVNEKRLISAALEEGKSLLGICLGAQLLAEVAGGRVFRGPYEEVGWLPVRLTADGRGHDLMSTFPDVFCPLHWHQDTFELPSGATCLASSEGYENQAFVLGDRALGIQFHVDLCLEDIRRIVRYQRFSKQGTYFQSREEVISKKENLESCVRYFASILDCLAQVSPIVPMKTFAQREGPALRARAAR